MFRLQLHPEAARAFDARASKILSSLQRGAPAPLAGQLTGSAAHVPIAGHIGPDDLVKPSTIVRSMEDPAGELVELAFTSATRVYELKGEAAAEVSRLALAASRRNELRTVCDSTFAKESLVKWLQASAERKNPQSWVEVLGADLAAAAADTAFRVPLVGIIIEEPFRLGPYLIAYFSRQDIQEHASQVPEEHRVTALRKFRARSRGRRDPGAAIRSSCGHRHRGVIRVGHLRLQATAHPARGFEHREWSAVGIGGGPRGSGSGHGRDAWGPSAVDRDGPRRGGPLGQRIAMMLGGVLEVKRQVISDVEDAYQARSAFIHHGEDVAERRETLNRALAACREVVHFCLRCTDVLEKQQLIRRLDDQLLAGGTG